jgi:prepilin-type processing-associated H-X9-DG protein
MSVCNAAFTLIELLVLLGVLGLGAVMLLPALAQTRPNTQTVQCLNNLRQLAYGAAMYTADNRDCFPCNASRNTFSFAAQDWIYWRTSPIYPNPSVTESPIVAGMSGVSSNWFRCPADRDDSERIRENTDGQGIYAYSYTLTSLTGGSTNYGISSLIDKTTGVARLFRRSSIKNPAAKIMFAEEQATHNKDEASDPTRNVVSDGRFVPSGDALTIRHHGLANVSFADGHVLPVTPQFGTNLANSRPDL